MPELRVDDFARAFDETPEAIARMAGPAIAEANLGYRRPKPAERDAIILDILKRLAAEDFTRVGAHRHDVWTEVWSEQLAEFTARGGGAEALDPKFVAARRTMRVFGDFARADDSRFEMSLYAIVRQILFERWLRGHRDLYEFGCGSCFNLDHFARLDPTLRQVGLDWAQPSVDLADALGRDGGRAIRGRRFDFFAPDPDLRLPDGAAVTTFCALEQVGDQFGGFVDFLLDRRPALCVHMEPLRDLYDPERLFDWLVLRYHDLRGYLTGFLDRLRAEAAAGRADILDVRRLGFGSLYHEAYSVVVWRPR